MIGYLDIGYLEADAQATLQARRDIAATRRKVSVDHPAFWALMQAEIAVESAERNLSAALQALYRAGGAA